MEEYSPTALNKKIHAFISKKIEKYPDLGHLEQTDINHRTEARPQKINWLHTFLPTQLRPSL